VHPSAHYTIGGVQTDLHGRTTLPGLYAAGEAAANGLHGANRLASNSLLEGLVFGKRAGLAAAETSSYSSGPVKIISDIHIHEHGELDLLDVLSSLKSVMWRNVGIERSGAKLDDVVDMFNFWGRYSLQHIFDEPLGWEMQNLLFVGALMTRAARWREETRGVHWRRDHPELREAFRRRAAWRAGDAKPVFLPMSTSSHAVT
jgi:L-aspartate oxidase